MKKFKTHLLAALGLVILVSALALLNPLESQGQRSGGPPGGMNVKVVNENTEPVPVAQAATADVNVVSLPVEPVSTFAFPTEPFQEEVWFVVEAGISSGSGSFFVPEGKCLVIEHVSAHTRMGVGQKLINAVIRTQQVIGGNKIFHTLAIVDQGGGPTTAYYSRISQHVRLYAVEEVLFYVNTSHHDGAYVSISVSGYLVDIN